MIRRFEFWQWRWARAHRRNRRNDRLKPVPLAAFGEERLEDGGAVCGEDARGDFYVVV
jgi:hypothetical protein